MLTYTYTYARILNIIFFFENMYNYVIVRQKDLTRLHKSNFDRSRGRDLL